MTARMLFALLVFTSCADEEPSAPYYSSCDDVCSYFATRFSIPTCPDPESEICWCKLHNRQIVQCHWPFESRAEEAQP